MGIEPIVRGGQTGFLDDGQGPTESGREGPSRYARPHLRLASVFALLIGVAAVITVASTPAGATTSDWTVYHQDLSGSGVDTSGAVPSSAVPAWTSSALDGQILR